MQKTQTRFRCPDEIEVLLRRIAEAECRTLNSLVSLACVAYCKEYLKNNPDFAKSEEQEDRV